MKKLLVIAMTFMMMFTAIPFSMGSLDSNAATGLVASARQDSVVLSWAKLSKKQQKKAKGIAIFRNGADIAHVSKKATSYVNYGLASDTGYTYQIKTFKTKKKKMWYNKATGQWQKKKPAKKYRGKSKKIAVYTYSNYTTATGVRTSKAPKPTAPTNPSGGTTENISITIYSIKGEGDTTPSIGLWWRIDKNLGVDIYRDGTKIASCDASTNSYHDTNVSWNETHSYQVKAVYNGKTYASESKSATSPTEPAPIVPEYIDVSDMYTYINEWRQDTSNHWIDWTDGRSNLTEAEVANLVTLKRDTLLEKAAEQRAMEQYLVTYQGQGTGANHSRPDGGKAADTLKEYGFNYFSECYAYGHNLTNHKAVIYGNIKLNGEDFPGWSEYDGSNAQGHRHAMLSLSVGYNQDSTPFRRTLPYTKVGLACYKVGNTYMYVMELAY